MHSVNTFTRVKRSFDVGEREHIARAILDCQWAIRTLHRDIAENAVYVPLALSAIKKFREMIATKRRILGLRT